MRTNPRIDAPKQKPSYLIALLMLALKEPPSSDRENACRKIEELDAAYSEKRAE